MITQILKKDYDKIQRDRKLTRSKKSGGPLYFKGEDGNYYKCDTPGMQGVKEIATFNRNFRQGIDNQTALI